NAGAAALAFGPDARLYAAVPGKKRIAAFDAAGKETVIAKDIAADDLAIDHGGRIYTTDSRGGRVWLIDSKGRKRVANADIAAPQAALFTPDQSLLLVSHAAPRKYVYSFRIGADG